MVDRVKLKKPTNNRSDKYPYLRFFRPNELISRVDRYSIIMYWDVYTSKGNPVQVNDFLFYPSEFGIEEIERYKSNRQLMTEATMAPRLIKRLDQLVRFGNPYWKYDVIDELTPDNWILRKPNIYNFKPINKNEELVIKYANLITNNKRKKLKVKNNKRTKLKVKNKKIKLSLRSRK